ncbi:MAG: 1-acyl-sn-glycerol-3-phosphate acyltransferase [Myxococcota bacterium]
MSPAAANRSQHQARPRTPKPGEIYRPNAALRWLYRRFFQHIRIDQQWKGVVQSAADKGTVVYVMRSISFLDFLCLDFLLKQMNLPLVRFVNDLGLWILEPMGKGGRRLRLKRQPPEEASLRSVVEENCSALLFLRQPPRLGSPVRKGGELDVDLIRTLVETQRTLEKPILLVPQTIVWSKLPPRREASIFDLIFGPVEWPGRVRVLLQFALNYRNAVLRSGSPFNLKDFVLEHKDLDDGRIADRVRYALLRRMERERTVVLGPTKKTVGRIKEELLRSPRVRKAMRAHARAEKKTQKQTELLTEATLSKLCADQNPHLLGFAQRFFDWVWNRMYDGIVIDLQGLEKLRTAARSGAVVLLPSHKSHVDYLVLSYVLYSNALAAPLIAAGDNLSFFPLGALLRRGGAFFIRRSFRGERLYSALVDAYIRKLLVEGFLIEFFVEGSRSRSGQLMSPKFGLLSMVVDASLLLNGRNVFFVPISISYERVIEQTSYALELSGGEKRKENLHSLLQTPNVLRSRYGRLYVQFGNIIDFHQMRQEILGPETSLSPKQRRVLIQSLGHKTMCEIDQATMVTPASLVATALLAHSRRGMPRSKLMEICDVLVEALHQLEARIAKSLIHDEHSLNRQAIDDAIGLFSDGALILAHETGGETIFTLPESERITLEYYKNNILHFFVPYALVASAVTMSRKDRVPLSAVRQRAAELAAFIRLEPVKRIEAELDERIDHTLKRLIGRELECLDDHVRIAEGQNGDPIQLYAAMLRPYFEAYVLALRGVSEILTRPMFRKEWMTKTLNLGMRMYFSGEIDHRESLSKHKLGSALESMKQQGLIDSKSDGTIQISEGIDADELDEAEARLQRILVQAH